MSWNLEDFIAERSLDEDEVEANARAMIAESRAYELREVRRAESLTQGQVAERMGISQARVSEVESGDVRSLKVDTLERYAEALGGSFLAYVQVGDRSVRLA